jgi:phenylacetate-CoA ligase
MDIEGRGMSAVASIAGFMKRHVVGPSLIRRNPFYYDRARTVIDEGERQDLAQRRAWSDAQLKRTLQVARRAAYGQRVQGGDTLESWPYLEKEKLRDQQAEFITGKHWLAAPASTGGTTGIPLNLVRSLRGVVFEQACQDRLIERLGAEPRGRVAILRGDNIKDPNDLKPPHWIKANGGNSLIFSSNVLNHETVADYARALRDFSPPLLCAYPTSLECLCRLLKQHGEQVHVPHVLTSSEVLKREAWSLARDTLGCELADYYGQSERVAFAYAFEPRAYRFIHTYAHVELRPFASDQLEDAGHGGLYEIIGTTFWNDIMPLVRYRTGDLVRLPDHWGAREIEEVTLGLRPFSGVLGREQEILVCPKGVRLTGIDHIPRDVRHILRIQVIQESLEDVRILVLPAAGYGQSDAAQLLQNARAKVPESMSLRIETAQWLERTPRGKTPLVIHRAPVQEHLRRQGFEPSQTR